MKRTVLSIVLLALTAHTCTAAIVVKTSKPEALAPLYEAAIDVLTTCYGDPGDAVGIVGDSDGSLLKTLWTNHSIPVVLVDTAMKIDNSVTNRKLHRLHVFLIVADSPQRFFRLMTELAYSVWWNHYANFLILNPTSDIEYRSLGVDDYLFIAYGALGILNAQFISLSPGTDVVLSTVNPYRPIAPKPWVLLQTRQEFHAPFTIFVRRYREGGQTCEALNFPKTTDVGGYPLRFVSNLSWILNRLANRSDASIPAVHSAVDYKIADTTIHRLKWMIENIAVRLNGTPEVSGNFVNFPPSLELVAAPILAAMDSTQDSMVHPLVQRPLIAVTQHTGHMSQLNKILSVVDRTSRIGMFLVYAITFLFFKFFLRQAAVPAVLNLVRLTCNTGLTRLPRNPAPTTYLAGLFMFVVTLQAIYTGNLASLLTRIIPYPHVNTRADVADLGYTVYTIPLFYSVLSSETLFDSPVKECSTFDTCAEYAVRDPSAAIVLDNYNALLIAYRLNLHVSRESMKSDYIMYWTSNYSPFGHRMETIMKEWNEYGHPRIDETLAKLQSEAVDDDEVKKNTVRRVMNLGDLSFAFVILGIGLACSFVCFIGEIAIYRISLKIGERRARDRSRLAWGVVEERSSGFSALRSRLGGLRLFSKGR